ncbi:MAG TPA: hypothetical protein VMZ53_23855 [Kofleriaceae bacterium]|nr:hypothetical protein [Kofleriaceae bacterium]
MKRLIFVFGLLGLIGCFLPVAGHLSLFDLRHFSEGWHVWLVIGAFALPTYVGLSKTEGDTAAAVVGTFSFGYLAYKFFGHIFDLAFHASIGGFFMAVATVLGLVWSLIALVMSSSDG